MARATRDLRYWSARRASAQLRERDPSVEGVQFGGSVTFDREDGRRQTFRIVGEDEADPTQGSVSYVSPVARALLGKGVGDTAMVAGGEVEIVAIDADLKSSPDERNDVLVLSSSWLILSMRSGMNGDS
jgi:transcription elongation GreA/GreB family factor